MIGFLALLTTPAAAGDRHALDLVRTDLGPVRGVVTAQLRTFQGIPYAAPPVGELRWRPPQPATRWWEPRDASRPGNVCAQAPLLGQPGSVTEDCLYLNVTTPARSRKRLPVMVWIHGGGYSIGSGAAFNPSKLVSIGDVIVVTINYRVGPFGFLALPELTAENPGIQSGNYGLEDQQAALRWVRRNAAAFGGDPGNITIFGESAGAGSVCLHLASPTAAGLFQRAAGQSFSCAYPTTTKQQAESDGVTYAQGLGCQDVACLRAKPVRELLPSWANGWPVIGGREFPLQPMEALRQDRFHHVPVLWGNNLDEMRLFVALEFDLLGKPVTPQAYEQVVRSLHGPAADIVLRKYPVTNYPTPSIALATVRTDFGWALSTCEHVRSYELFSAHPRPVPVYAYQFVDRTAPGLLRLPGFEEGASHGQELNYLWVNYFGTLNPQQEALSQTMVRYWTNFARSGDPNGASLPSWERYSSPREVLALDIPPGGIRPLNVAEASNCAFWESLRS